MDQHTMPLPRDPRQTIPSFRELEEKIKADRLEDHRHQFLNNDDSTADGSSASPNLYPPYPARGWRIPVDPSHNAYLKAGFTSQGVLDEGPYAYQDPAIPEGVSPMVNLPIRSRVHRISTTTMQTSSYQPRILQEREAPNVTGSSPRSSKRPSNSPCSSTTEKLAAPPRAIRQTTPQQKQQTRKQKVEEALQRRPPAQNNRARLQKIGVQFSDVAAHTAKCDECNRRNQNGMSRCKQCGWQICNKCKNERSGDQSHTSFGSIHVPEVGGNVPLDGAQDSRPSIGSLEKMAAQVLLDLASGGGQGLHKRLDMTLSTSHHQEFQQRADTPSTSSDVTVSIAGDDGWPSDESGFTIDDDGLLMGYFIARRNPARAARPSAKMTE